MCEMFANEEKEEASCPHFLLLTVQQVLLALTSGTLKSVRGEVSVRGSLK